MVFGRLRRIAEIPVFSEPKMGSRAVLKPHERAAERAVGIVERIVDRADDIDIFALNFFVLQIREKRFGGRYVYGDVSLRLLRIDEIIFHSP